MFIISLDGNATTAIRSRLLDNIFNSLRCSYNNNNDTIHVEGVCPPLQPSRVRPPSASARNFLVSTRITYTSATIMIYARVRTELSRRQRESAYGPPRRVGTSTHSLHRLYRARVKSRAFWNPLFFVLFRGPFGPLFSSALESYARAARCYLLE